jgi:hypothetical protein
MQHTFQIRCRMRRAMPAAQFLADKLVRPQATTV